MSEMESVATDSPKRETNTQGSPASHEVAASGNDGEHMEKEEQIAPQAEAEQPQDTEVTPSGEEDQIEEEVGEEIGESEVEVLQAELEKAQAQATEYLDGWQRARAEFANYRKRVEAEREALRRTSNESLLLKLLPVVDDFERAIQTLPEDMADEPWINGVQMILRKLQGILESENVTPILAIGQPFDPFLHEAVMQEETTDHPDGYVIEEIQRGYRLGEHVLRPSMVKVANNTNDSDGE